MASGKDAPIQRLEDELFEKLYAGEAELLPERSRDSKWAAWASAIHDACDKSCQRSIGSPMRRVGMPTLLPWVSRSCSLATSPKE